MTLRHIWPRIVVALALVLILPLPVKAAEQATAPSDKAEAITPGQTPRYTEDEARMIMTSHGYNGVGRLTLDENLVWRGTAIQYG